jgi:predicted enzyme related to lactoylglutathione lyase
MVGWYRGGNKSTGNTHQQEAPMGQPVVHWELWSKNPGKLSDFYEKVFSWNIRHIPEMNYNMVETGGGGGINGGIMTPQEGPWPGNMAFYIDVDDLDAYGRKVEEAGGKIVVDKIDVPGMGQFSLFEDPDGRVLGMWKQQK